MNYINERIKHISSQMLDVAERQLATLKTAPAPSRPPPAVARRALANSLALWNFCPSRGCRRARCCRGEPSHCLRIALPLLPPDVVAGLMQGRKRGRRNDKA